jgi:hypothetical protein
VLYLSARRHTVRHVRRPEIISRQRGFGADEVELPLGCPVGDAGDAGASR